jgi:branched-chain amino acid transport system permease protein
MDMREKQTAAINDAGNQGAGSGMMQSGPETVNNPRNWTPVAYGIIVVILACLPLIMASPYILHVFILTFTYIVATVSLRLVTTSGQYPLAHAAFMGIGAYTSAVIAKLMGVPVWITIPLGGIVAMIIGAFIAYPFARLRAFYYAMVSLFFGLGVNQLILVLTKWTQGAGGLVSIPHLLPTVDKVPYYYFFLGFAAICLAAIWRFEHSRFGVSLKAIAQSHMVASSVGINEVWYRVMALAIGCFFAGVTGAAYAHYNFTLSPTSFDMMAGLWLFIYALIGGIGNFSGPVIGTALLVIVPQLLSSLKAFVPFISAGILLIVFYVMHDGLVGLPKIIMSAFRRRGHNPGSGKITPAMGG